MNSKTFHIPDIGCDACVRAIRLELEDMGGVDVLAADVAQRIVTVAWRAPASEPAIVQALGAIDYPPAPA